MLFKNLHSGADAGAWLSDCKQSGTECTSPLVDMPARDTSIFKFLLGIHKFYLGYNLPGLILLLVALFGHLGLFIPNVIALIVSVVEGVIYLTKSDEDFDATYVSGTKHWF